MRKIMCLLGGSFGGLTDKIHEVVFRNIPAERYMMKCSSLVKVSSPKGRPICFHRGSWLRSDKQPKSSCL